MANIKSEFLCAICMDNISNCDKYITKCNHEFCIQCLFKYLEMDHHSQNDTIPCPICRSDISNIIRDEQPAAEEILITEDDESNISDLFDIISIQNNLREEIGAPSIDVPQVSNENTQTITTINGNVLFDERFLFTDRPVSRIIRSPVMQFHYNLQSPRPSTTIPLSRPELIRSPRQPYPPALIRSQPRIWANPRYSNSSNTVNIAHIWHTTGRYPRQNQQ
jgi:hypothetical protein